MKTFLNKRVKRFALFSGSVGCFEALKQILPNVEQPTELLSAEVESYVGGNFRCELKDEKTFLYIEVESNADIEKVVYQGLKDLGLSRNGKLVENI
jgi:hypothetical protein